MTNFSYALSAKEAAALDWVVAQRNLELAAQEMPQDVTPESYLAARVKDILASYERLRLEELGESAKRQAMEEGA